MITSGNEAGCDELEELEVMKDVAYGPLQRR